MSAGERSQLLGGFSLLSFVAAVGGALFFMLPSTPDLEGLNSAGPPSELSIQHLRALIAANPAPTEADVCSMLNANLCRCGCQPRVVRAVLRAAGRQA